MARKPAPDLVVLRYRIQQRISEARHALKGWRIRLHIGKLAGRSATVKDVCVFGDKLYVMLEKVSSRAGPSIYLFDDNPDVRRTVSVDTITLIRPSK